MGDTVKEKANFTDTIHCLGRRHCNNCRNLEEGHNWRRNLLKLYVLPNNNVDFECPYGKKWGEVTEVPEHLAPLSPATKDASCIPCGKRNKALGNQTRNTK